ncbi:metalloregulator ArsR/SmtB family transcription factor [Kordiimonas sp. SCSIO 12610]|uniref:ArsR/SmtB family transcription factor n=1 Tax=Kordiimonas sp. SCSIO 12610 TaxID=2829597 RepID=UPI00210D133C|nr:metalloregulator ArsR/SmtB family transcription factor [Kordiimonas sp. SCSIO 12610]UTW54643.1 winged helix-turn-helix transcriptional regulator [Kordiimonas sp. SCSIO 12610]
MNIPMDQMEPLAEEATSLLKALAHPSRLMICCKLRHAELSVGDIEKQLQIKQPNLSRELMKLRDEGLVETRRESKVIFYRLADKPRVQGMIDGICAVMLGQAPAPATMEAPSTNTPKRRPNPAGGYGVFATTRSSP